MPNSYDRARDFAGRGNADKSGAARDWYTLQASHLGAQELPAYGRALRVRMGSGSSAPLTIVGVPISAQDDASTRTIRIDATEFLPFAFRRIVSLNGNATIPDGVDIEVITE